jgi:glycosyltransferase involved in cell wall biosynthesis
VMDASVHVHRLGPGEYPLPAGRMFYPFRKVCRNLFPHSLVRLAWASEAEKAFHTISEQFGRFDIIEYPECGGEGFRLRTLPPTVCITRMHTPWELVAKHDDIKESWADALMLSYMERSCARDAHGVSSPSQALADMYKSKWHIPRIAVFPNPIPSDHYQQSTGNNWIFTGRVEKRKGVHILIRAYAAALKDKQLPKLYIIGRAYGDMHGISYEQHIDNLIAQNNLSSSVEWIRGTDNETVRKYLLQSSVAIFPSLWENLSYSCLEAMACGCIVIATQTGGFPEMIDNGKNGFLVKANDVDSLAHILGSITNETKQLGIAARQKVKTLFDSTVICAKVEKWYLTLLTRKKNG